jgi:tRNA A-37 threonylcarbamoyl transferase component Bud32
MAVPVVLFRFLAPNESFPIRYGKEQRRIDLDAARLDRIRASAGAQLGWIITDIDVLRLPGTSGSTPLRLHAHRDAADGTVERCTFFAKLYSRSHLRADRWYKLGRAILYGRLEDEAPFAELRHMVEHEDYMLRIAAEAGVPVPRTFGIVHVRAGREHLLVMADLPDARQLVKGECTSDVAREGMRIVELLWRAGIAHRDIKPANLVISDGVLYLVDLGFAELNPTAWRQAVDLGNMVLCCAWSGSVADTMAAARMLFTEDEIAEALAATRSVTVPAQLRRIIGGEGPALVAALHEHVREHPTIRVQRWTAARFALTGATLATAVGAAWLLAYNLGALGLR